MPKRSFERRDGKLWDTYLDPGGCLTRVIWRDRAARGHESDELESASLDQLLELLKNGELDRPSLLLRFVDDKRVLPELVAAARRVDSRLLPNFAAALGQAGGEEAANALRERLVVLRSQYDADGGSFLESHSLITVAAALLLVDRTSEDGANVLASLLNDRSTQNRQLAASRAGEILRARPAETIQRILSAAVLPRLDDDDPDVFAAAGPALAMLDRPALDARCARLLAHADERWRWAAARTLITIADAEAIARLEQHLPAEAHLPLACAIAIGLKPRPLSVDVVGLARRALAEEAPTIRMQGIVLLELLDRDTAREVALEAMTDEPDVDLQGRLSKIGLFA